MSRRKFSTGLAVAAFAILAIGRADAADFVIAERGKAASVAVVIAKEARPAVRWAAGDFARHVRKMTGVGLQVVDGDVPQGMKAIRVTSAAPEAARDGFTIAASEQGIEIAGTDDRGAAYGLFELLERFGGCGWYSLTYSYVPRIDRFAVPAGYRDSQTAAFESRESFWYDLNHSDELAFHLRANARMLVKTRPEYGGCPHRFGGGLGACHTFGRLLPAKEHFRDHPEYFAWHGGHRVPDQPCLTNPEVLKIVTSNVLAAIASDPDAKYFGVSQNDNFCYCKCDACHAIEVEEGSYAGTVLRFVNAVANEVKKVYPDKIVETLAYHYTRKPPSKTKPRDNVMICLCSIECDFAHPLATGTYPQNVSFRDDTVGWGKIAKKIYVWDYVTNFQHYLNPFVNEGVMAENLKFYRDHGVTMMFEQGDMTGRHGDLAPYKQWLLAKLMWNPDADVKALTDRFLHDYYGAGAPFVAKYLELRAQNAAQPLPMRIFEEAVCPRFNLAELDRMADLWRKAEAAVKGDPDRLYNVRMDSLAVDYARIRHLVADGAKLYGVCEKAPDYSRVRELAKRFVAIRGECREGEIPLVEGCEDAARTIELITRLARRNDDPPSEVGEELCMRLMFYPWGHYGTDPLARDGRSLMIKPEFRVWSGQVDLREAAYTPGEKYTVSLRVRVEPAADAKPSDAAFTFGVQEQQPKDTSPDFPGTRTVRIEETSSAEYRWFDLPPMTLVENLSIWFRCAAYDKTPATSRIHVDAVRIRR